jgi:tRNA1Val (adenine37-N6)-methyltransferase
MANQIQSKKNEVRSVLDIGAGTGLLSLMLAQKSDAQIDAVELDEQAAEQAAENFANSPWPERLQLIQGDAKFLSFGKKYDCIISNPPFFDNDLKSINAQRNLALHSEALSLAELVSIIQNNLTNQGLFAVLLPFHRQQEMIALAEKSDLFLLEKISVKQSDKHSYFRIMLLFGKQQATVCASEIPIREDENYSATFRQLLADYYLK